jgi:hypothetical protein
MACWEFADRQLRLEKGAREGFQGLRVLPVQGAWFHRLIEGGEGYFRKASFSKTLRAGTIGFVAEGSSEFAGAVLIASGLPWFRFRRQKCAWGYTRV